MSSDPIHQHAGKWFFWDETWAHAHGPYASREEAVAALKEYCRTLGGEQECNCPTSTS